MRERTVVKDVLWCLAFAGAVAMALRLIYGLGATTHLSDSVPWGLWKIVNMVAGVALSTGGFTVGLLVYVLRLERFRPLMKPAILIAFLGYGSSCFALFLDIGLPHRIWHPLVMWNERSFLFEVAWCVMLYFTVTVIELSPTLLERFRANKLAHALHRVAPGVVIVGIALSSLHHSSLGSLFLVTPQRLYPLWFSPRLPLFFILSAMGAGMMVVVLAKMLYARWYDPASVFPGAAAAAGAGEGATGAEEPPHLRMIRQLATIAAGILSLYLALKVVDLFATGAWAVLLRGSWESWLYLAELSLTAVVPIALMAIPRARRAPAGIALAAGSASAGLLLNRLDVGVFGYFHDAGRIYVPSLAEWALSLGIIAAAGLVFLKLVESAGVFDERWRERWIVSRRFAPTFDRFSRVWRGAGTGGFRRASLIAVLVIPVATVALYPPYRVHRGAPARAPLGLDAERATLLLEGQQPTMAVAFDHRAHQQRNGGASSCVKCHHLSYPGDHATACSRCHRRMEGSTDIFDHAAHFDAVARSERLGGIVPGNRSCDVCHRPGEAKSARTARACQDCHSRTARVSLAASDAGHGGLDMLPASSPTQPHEWTWAPGHLAVLHKQCIGCHAENAAAARRRLLQGPGPRGDGAAPPGSARGAELQQTRAREHLAWCPTCHKSLRSQAQTRTTMTSPAGGAPGGAGLAMAPRPQVPARAP
jgi:Ni/Fe-hydrogenase subunit HybB-like protein/Zn finger protein HypA/HybF involved in hydrogenase expression